MNGAYRASGPVRAHLVYHRSKPQGVAQDLHHGNETCSDLWLSDLVVEDQMQHHLVGA
jgi:hypothetical protein